jgi:class 3 adenylate cyclase
MLRAIRELGTVAVAASSATVETEPARRDDAERRQLTVMFTDLVGSTVLSTKLDPEDLRSVIGAYHKCVAETVARFDGFVAKYMGDGVLVYFGYPHAHEDDAERAIQAGLALIDAVSKLRIQEPLRVRIGVAAGVVVGGDLIGSGRPRNAGSWVRRLIWLRACRRWPSPIRSSSLRAPDGFSAVSSSWRTSAP